MEILEHATTIQTPPADCWQVRPTPQRTGAKTLSSPSRSIPSAPVNVLARTIHAGRKARRFRPTVIAVEGPSLIRWRGRLGMPGIFDSDHEPKLEPTSDDGTRVTQHEILSGVLVPVNGRCAEGHRRRPPGLGRSSEGAVGVRTAHGRRSRDPEQPRALPRLGPLPPRTPLSSE